MSTWFYFDEQGQKQGPYNGGQLKWLAKNGKICPETIIETEAGKTAPARKVKGLTFITPEPISLEKTPSEIVQSIEPNTFTAEEQEEIDKFCAEHGTDVKAVDKDGDTLLLKAIGGGKSSIAVIKFLVNRGADVNAKNNLDLAPLHEAALSGNIEVVKLLLSKGADVNVMGGYDGSRNDKGITLRLGTPLHVATSRRDVELIKFLISKGANVNELGGLDYETPLHIATQRKNVEIVKILISAGANVNIADRNGGVTPLLQAASDGNVEIAKILVSSGADVNAKFADGTTPLDFAKNKKDTAMIQCFCSVSAASTNSLPASASQVSTSKPVSPFVETPPEVSSSAEQNTFTVEEQAEIDKFCAEHGRDIKAVVDEKGRTLLHKAIGGGKSSIAVIKFLVNRGADVNARDKDGDTLLNTAALMMFGQYKEEESAAVIKYLVSKEADVNTKNKSGRTPLHYVTSSAEIVKLLVSKGADVNAKDENGVTPLWEAANNGYIESVKILISRGADINAKVIGLPPIQIAIMTGQVEMVKFLASNGADVNAKDDNGISPIQKAIMTGWEVEEIKVLVSNGADIDITINEHGATLLDLAKHLENQAMIQYLSSVFADRQAAQTAGAFTNAGTTNTSSGATVSLVLGIVGLLAWCLPIIGLPITITGLVFGYRSNTKTGIILNSIGLALSIFNAAIGAFLAKAGQL
jgi:ankyrin repeat protein